MCDSKRFTLPLAGRRRNGTTRQTPGSARAGFPAKIGSITKGLCWNRLWVWMLPWLCPVDLGAAASVVKLSAESLHDKIRGRLLGQILGNLNGLEHEMKYIADPGTDRSVGG